MPDERIELRIESLTMLEQIDPEPLVKSAIALFDEYSLNPFPFDVECRNIVSTLVNEQGRMDIDIGWDVQTYPNPGRLFKTFQRESVVEDASVAVALLLVGHVTDFFDFEVTVRGEKADYYFNGRRLMLEVSGTESVKQFSKRCRDKVRQLESNPYDKPGYVVVCCFSTHKTRLSFLHPQSTREAL